MLESILILIYQGGPGLVLLLAIVIVMLAKRTQSAIGQRFQFKLVTRWHVGGMLLLLIAPMGATVLYSNRCRSLEDLPLAPIIWGVFVIASVSLCIFNKSRSNLKYGVLATLIQMCIFSLALAAGAVPAAILETLGSMGAGGMHACGERR